MKRTSNDSYIRLLVERTRNYANVLQSSRSTYEFGTGWEHDGKDVRILQVEPVSSGFLVEFEVIGEKGLYERQ